MDKFRTLLMLRPWERHKLILVVGGHVYILLGVIFYFQADEMTILREQSLVVALRMLPFQIWAVFFFVTGVAGIMSARWPTFSDSWGYMLLTGLSAGWGTMYMLGYLIGESPVSNVTFGLVWLLVAFLWWSISSLLNQPKDMGVVNGPD